MCKEIPVKVACRSFMPAVASAPLLVPGDERLFRPVRFNGQHARYEYRRRLRCGFCSWSTDHRATRNANTVPLLMAPLLREEAIDKLRALRLASAIPVFMSPIGLRRNGWTAKPREPHIEEAKP